MNKRIMHTGANPAPTFAQMVNGLKSGCGGNGQSPLGTFKGRGTVLTRDGAKTAAVQNAKGQFPNFFYKDAQDSALCRVMECFLEHRMLAVGNLSKFFSADGKVALSTIHARSMLTVEFFDKHNRECTFIIDVTDTQKLNNGKALPAFLFAGYSQAVGDYLKKFNSEVAVRASKNGAAAIFAPLHEYLGALA